MFTRARRLLFRTAHTNFGLTAAVVVVASPREKPRSIFRFAPTRSALLRGQIRNRGFVDAIVVLISINHRSHDHPDFRIGFGEQVRLDVETNLILSGAHGRHGGLPNFTAISDQITRGDGKSAFGGPSADANVKIFPACGPRRFGILSRWPRRRVRNCSSAVMPSRAWSERSDPGGNSRSRSDLHLLPSPIRLGGPPLRVFPGRGPGSFAVENGQPVSLYRPIHAEQSGALARCRPSLGQLAANRGHHTTSLRTQVFPENECAGTMP